MTATTKLDHCSHEHPLILIDDFDSSSIAAPLECCLCESSIIGLSPAYTCSQEHSPCSFFLHKRCAESAELIIHPLHPQHQLFLGKFFINQGRSYYPWIVPAKIYFSCAACTREINLDMWVYQCTKPVTCDHFVMCARCALMEQVLCHQGHEQHPLTLLSRRASFQCDACGTESADIGSYTCHICQYWIHSSCAFFPHTIKLQIHENDTLQLIYSIPELYRSFTRHCPICRFEVKPKYWAYSCEMSGYFVHVKCAAALLASGKNVTIIEDDAGHTYPNLMQFPRPSTDSLIANLIAEHQSGKLINTNAINNIEDGPVIHHWSHPEHPLILLEELKNADNRDDDDDDEIDTKDHIDEMLVCNGCIQPISTYSDKRYYGCIGCNYFLHTSCANHLSVQSPPGKCARDPEHVLELRYYNSSLKMDNCQSCYRQTNGFRYMCKTCFHITDICCSLAPTAIKHEYHKHPLIQRNPTSDKTCNACLELIDKGFEYGCESCSNIQIHQRCALSFPKIISHRWDSHSIFLIYPPIYYKGIRYCEICELEVNQEAWLYCCRECDQYFHPLCIRQPHNAKLGYPVGPSTRNFHSHPLTLRFIDNNWYPERIRKSLSCREIYCGMFSPDEPQKLFLECADCNYLLCQNCVHKGLRFRPAPRSPFLM